jgi:hypothetical protein
MTEASEEVVYCQVCLEDKMSDASYDGGRHDSCGGMLLVITQAELAAKRAAFDGEDWAAGGTDFPNWFLAANGWID